MVFFRILSPICRSCVGRWTTGASWWTNGSNLQHTGRIEGCVEQQLAGQSAGTAVDTSRRSSANQCHENVVRLGERHRKKVSMQNVSTGKRLNSRKKVARYKTSRVVMNIHGIKNCKGWMAEKNNQFSIISWKFHQKMITSKHRNVGSFRNKKSAENLNILSQEWF